MIQSERWKYTSLRALDGFPFSAPKAKPVSDVKIPVLPFETSGRLVFVDGFFVETLSDFSSPITLNMIEAFFPDENPFMKHLPEALSEGIEITVESGIEIAKPIDLVFLFTDNAEDCALHMHHRVHLKSHANASFVIRYLGDTKESYVANIHTVFDLEAASKATLYHIQLQGEKAYHVENIRFNQSKDSEMTVHTLTLGALLTRIDMNAHYQAAHAQSHIYGVYHVSGRQHVDYHLDAEHFHPFGRTTQHVKGCVDDNARAVFNGRVSVKPGAVKAYSEQSHHGLLLSRRARIDAKPELEIDCDDVQCRHGATVGALRADALFYLMSRGFNESQAKATLQLAHASSLIDEISVPEIREYMHHTLMSVAFKQEAACLI
ncbi:MAG: Fe-S cluster assembly protein SufD [Gammaproteobacteria bacterium]